MKKMYNFIIVVLLCVVLVAFGAVPASATGTVTYNGNAEKFIFEPGSKYSPTDLFTEYKNVMPGATLKQEVLIKNDISNDVKIKLYMRALGPTPGTEEYVSEEFNNEFLSKLNLSVSVRDGEELFNAPANETAGLTDWVYLGTFYSGAEVYLDVLLTVPLSLGNEYQSAIGFLDWQFKVEEFPKDPNDPTEETGDYNTVAIFGVTACLSIAVIAFLVVPKSKKQEEV